MYTTTIHHVDRHPRRDLPRLPEHIYPAPEDVRQTVRRLARALSMTPRELRFRTYRDHPGGDRAPGDLVIISVTWPSADEAERHGLHLHRLLQAHARRAWRVTDVTFYAPPTRERIRV